GASRPFRSRPDRRRGGLVSPRAGLRPGGVTAWGGSRARGVGRAFRGAEAPHTASGRRRNGRGRGAKARAAGGRSIARARRGVGSAYLGARGGGGSERNEAREVALSLDGRHHA